MKIEYSTTLLLYITMNTFGNYAFGIFTGYSALKLYQFYNRRDIDKLNDHSHDGRIGSYQLKVKKLTRSGKLVHSEYKDVFASTSLCCTTCGYTNANHVYEKNNDLYTNDTLLSADGSKPWVLMSEVDAAFLHK